MIRPRTSCAFAAAVVLAMETNLAAAAGQAGSPQPPPPITAVRSGNHADYGRLVIETNGQSTYELEQDGNHVVVRFADDIILGKPPPAPRNIYEIITDGPTLDLTLRRGVKIHPMRIDGRVVIDILDASAKTRPGEHPPLTMASSPELGGRSAASAGTSTAVTTEQTPVAAQPLPPGQTLNGQPTGLSSPGQSPLGPIALGQAPSGQTPSGQTSLGQTSAARPTPDPGVVQATRKLPPGRDVMPENDGPVALLARRVKLPKEMDGAALLIPFDPATAAASFRSSDNAYIIFDERRPVDMSALRGDPAFSAASVQLLPNGTLLRVPLGPGQSIALTQLPQGWRVAALTTAARQQPIVASFKGGHLNLAAEQPGDVISLADPDTGATLLVGTQHRPGQGLANIRRGAEFVLRPTTQGVVVEALADAVVLQQTPTGFSLTGGPGGLLLSPPTSATDALLGAALLTGD